MIIKINGKDEIIDKKMTLAEFVSGKGLCPERIVTEYNSRITSKDEWRNITLQENDTVEIISFVGGG